MKGNKKGKKETTTNKKCLNESDTLSFLPKIVLTRDIFFFAAQDITLFGDRHVAQQT